MPALTPAFSRFNVSAGNTVEVYYCPGTKTHAYVDLSFFKDANPGSSLIAVSLATESNPANLTSVDQFIDDIELIDTANVASLEKVVVGAGQRLYVKVVSGSDVSARVVAMEENNSKVAAAGRLAAVAVAGTGQTQIYANAIADIAYISSSITIYNANASTPADIQGWISTAETPTAQDKSFKFSLPAQDTTILSNFVLAPNEKFFVQSSLANAEYFVVGTVVKV